MKRFWFGLAIGLGLGIFGTLLVGGAWWLFIGSSGFSYVGSGHTPPQPESAEGGGLSVALGGTHDHSVVFSKEGKEFVFSPSPHEVCKDPAVSPDGRIAFLLVQKEERFGYDYGCILQFAFSNGPLVEIQPQRILSPRQLEGFFGGRRAWVNKLHKLSPTGDAVLLSISAEDTNRSSGGSTYYINHPFWYDVKSNSIKEP
jgi:hypothetical protein